MAKTTVQVVLRDHVENLGRCGELVRVKPGYARNYLLPLGLAAAATRGNVAQIEHEQALAIKRAAALEAGAKAELDRLTGVRVEITAKAGDKGKLFGSIGSKDIAAALAAKGFEVSRKQILLPDPIKDLGDHNVPIKVGHEMQASVKVTVLPAE